MREGLELLKRAEIEPATVGPDPAEPLPRIIGAPDWLFNRFFLKRWKIDAKARSSMADDLAAGRQTEVDYINGELVRLAERLQRAAPVNRAIVELVRKAEAGAKPLGPAALRKAVAWALAVGRFGDEGVVAGNRRNRSSALGPEVEPSDCRDETRPG